MTGVEILGVVTLILILLRIKVLSSQRRKTVAGKNRIQEIRIGTAGAELLTVEQLSSDKKRVVCRFRITNIPGSGIIITRCSEKPWTISLREGMECTNTVRTPHAALAVDKAGFYMQSLEDSPMFLNGTLTDEISITDGVIVYLDQQPLRFRTRRSG